MIPLPGDVVAIGPRAGLQYRFCRPFLFRVGTVERPGHSPDGSFWLTGVELDIHNRHVEGGHREIWIQDQAGVSLVDRRGHRTVTRRARNDGPARIPQQRRALTVARSGGGAR